MELHLTNCTYSLPYLLFTHRLVVAVPGKARCGQRTQYLTVVRAWLTVWRLAIDSTPAARQSLHQGALSEQRAGGMGIWVMMECGARGGGSVNQCLLGVFRRVGYPAVQGGQEISVQ